MLRSKAPQAHARATITLLCGLAAAEAAGARHVRAVHCVKSESQFDIAASLEALVEGIYLVWLCDGHDMLARFQERVFAERCLTNGTTVNQRGWVGHVCRQTRDKAGTP